MKDLLGTRRTGPVETSTLFTANVAEMAPTTAHQTPFRFLKPGCDTAKQGLRPYRDLQPELSDAKCIETIAKVDFYIEADSKLISFADQTLRAKCPSV